MKSLLRAYLFHLFALGAVKFILGGSFTAGGGISDWLLAALVLSLLNLLLAPILKLLFLPINLLTLGLFSLVINTGVFYLFLKLAPGVKIAPWDFPGLNLLGIVLPPAHLSYVITLFAASLLISVITNFLLYLVK